MQKTNIEWVKNPDGTQGYTWNPITGCLNHTPEGLCLGGMFPCYAFKLANGRLKQRYLANKNIAPIPYPNPTLPLPVGTDPFYPRFWDLRLVDPYAIKKPCGIFTVDMGELFGDWIPKDWREKIFAIIKSCPQHRFYPLTKQPQNLINFSPFPNNCWVGVTVTTDKQMNDALYFNATYKAKIKFLSLEPLLGQIDKAHLALYRYDWLIIGACTGNQKELLVLAEGIAIKQGKTVSDFSLMPYGNKWTLQPKIEWVEEIVRAADKAGIPVFLKNNLIPIMIDSVLPQKAELFYSETGLRQEMPE